MITVCVSDGRDSRVSFVFNCILTLERASWNTCLVSGLP